MHDGPQLEDGFTRIANELLEALCKMPLGNSESQIFFCILRKTYGWGKKQDDISISQIESATGLSRRMVIYGIQNLEACKLLKVNRKKGRGIKNEINDIAIQKNNALWVVQGKSIQYKNTLEKQRLAYTKRKDLVVQGLVGSARIDDLVVQGLAKKGEILAPTKETLKETTKESKVNFFFSSLWKEYPRQEGLKAAQRHFTASVKTESDCWKIVYAMMKYKSKLKKESTETKYTKKGETWFNNWMDWIPEDIDQIISQHVKLNEHPWDMEWSD